VLRKPSAVPETARTTKNERPRHDLSRWYLGTVSAGIVVTLEEYLNTAYSPDREYVDGVVVERNVGEGPHSLVQSNVLFALRLHYRDAWVWPEWRSRTLAGRFRIPDVCVTLQNPGTLVLEQPPFLIVEILSRHDAMSDVLEKLEEYASIGVPNIWMLDPWRRKAFRFAANRLEEVTGGVISTSEPSIQVSLDEVFRGL